MMRLAVILMLSVIPPACAARGPQPPEPAEPALWEGDAQLYHMLSEFPLGAARADSLSAYTAARADGLQQLAIAAEDPGAPAAVRANALLTLARLRASSHFYAFRSALDDRDPRVRATAVAAMREFMDVRETDALQIARIALRDPALEVQAQALQILGDHDIALLRSYLAGRPPAELARIAGELVAVAEERGEPLVRDSATGGLRRTTTHGHVVEFVPTRRMPQWEAAVGSVTVRPVPGVPFTIADIEVVADVVPLFFSPDGRSLVYERDRQIIVRDVASGAERQLGAGVAPRPRPFTDEFFFLREPAENSRVEQRERTLIRYELLTASFRTAAAPTSHARLGAMTAFNVRGGYSPVRWAVIEERDGTFYLTAQNMESVALPSPFTGTVP
ncbi:MAG TPA: HEAT repeat domain-containing protein [Longimicrobiales bacterium]|nr:HEAT repeat domain-containing protein [Longimicrobiales bacterium]